MSDTLDAKLDSAIATVSATQASTAPPEPTSTPTAEKPLPSTPAPRSGSERRSTATTNREGATIQPSATVAASTSTADPTPGEPPQEKWESILSNARRDAAAEVEARYGGLKAEDYTATWKPHIEAIQSNPVAYLRWLESTLQQRGLLQPSTQTQPRSEPDAMPEPSMFAVDEQGRRTAAYSAEDVQKALKFAEGNWSKQLDTRLRPLEQTAHDSRVQQIRSSAEVDAQKQLEEAGKWEGFEELKPKIAALMQRDGRRTLESAYLHVYHSEYLPTSKAKNRQAVLDELKTAPTSQVAPTPQPRSNGQNNGRRGANLDDRIARATEAVFAQMNR